jgi:hypothetical protein
MDQSKAIRSVVAAAVCAVGLVTTNVSPASAANGSYNCTYYVLNGVATSSFSSQPKTHSHTVNGVNLFRNGLTGNKTWYWSFKSGTWAAEPSGSQSCW